MNKYELGPSPIPNNITFYNPDGEPVMVITKDSITVLEGVTVDEASQAVIAALEKYIKALVAAEREKVAAWMVAHLYATGHGDTTEDMLKELEWQIAERERKACADIAAQYASCEGIAQKIEQEIRERGEK